MRRPLLAFVVSLLVLAAFLLVLGPVELAAELAATDPLLFALGLLAMLVTLGCWSEGLRPLLTGAGARATSWRVLVAYCTSMLGRQLLPAGALGGPALTALTVERETVLAYDRTLAAVTVAEFLSVLASLALTATAIPVLLLGAPTLAQLRPVLFAVGLFVVVLLGGTLLFWFRRRTIERALLGAVRFLGRTIGTLSARLRAWLAPDRVRAALGRFYETVDVIAADPATLSRSFGLHLAGWVFAAVPLYTSALALDVRLPFALALVLVPVGDLVAVLPLPGGLGGTEIALAALLAALAGLALPRATAVVLLYRLCSYWFLILVGAVASVFSATRMADLGVT
jgi:hypothetical protein